MCATFRRNAFDADKTHGLTLDLEREPAWNPDLRTSLYYVYPSGTPYKLFNCLTQLYSTHKGFIKNGVKEGLFEHQ